MKTIAGSLAKIGIVAVALTLGCRLPAAALVDDFTGKTWYVDAANPVAGEGSAGNPFRTIQAAVDAATALDRIEIASGTYDAGTTATTLGGCETLSRVTLNKKLYLHGAGLASIVKGADAESPDAYGNGTGAVRCLLATADAAGSLIEGLAFEGGRTLVYDATQTTSDTSLPNFREMPGGATTNKLAMTGRNIAACGGGCYYLGASRTEPIYLVDCSFTDCRAGFAGGAVYGWSVLVRDYVATSYALAGYGGTVTRVVGAFSSVFSGNGRVLKDCFDTVHGAPANYSDVDGTFVNCTFNGNLGGGIPLTTDGTAKNASYSAARRFEFYNSIFFVHGIGQRHVNGNTLVYNCCQNMYGSLLNSGSGGAAHTNLYGNIGSDTYPRLQEDNLPFGRFQFVSGYARDCRLRAGSFLLEKGSNTWITTKAAFVPEEYRTKDFYGKDRIQGTYVDQGAAEGGYATNGCVYAFSSSYPLRVNGCLYDTWGYVFYGLQVSGQPGEVLELEADMGEDSELFGFTTTGLTLVPYASSYRYLYPNGREKKVALVVSPSTGSAVTYTVQPATSVKWVDPVNGVDDSSHGTEAAPYRTLQYAHNQSSAKGVVFAKPGQYAEGEGGSMTDGDWIKTTACRLTISKSLRICGLEGAERTFIMGRHSTDASGFTNDGCGAGALRCVGFATGGADGAIQGFTLTGGATDSDPIGKWKASGKEKSPDNDQCYNWAGAGICGWSWPSGGQVHQQLFDCIISNNVAYHSTAALNVFAHRCIFTDNRTVNQANETNVVIAFVGRLSSNCAFSNCLFFDNDGITNTLVVSAGAGWPVVNCTFGPTRSGLSPITSGAAHGCVFLNCGALNNISGSGNVVWPSAGNWSMALARIVADPCLSDTSTRRFVPSVASLAATSAVWSDVCALAIVPFGLDGAPFAVRADGTYPAGCWQQLLTGASASATGESGISPAGSVGVEAGESVTFTASDAATRNFLGFEINGELVTGETSYTWAPFRASELLTIKAVYGTNWYVNASAVDDSGTGWTSDSPKRTLTAALANTVAGDVVHVAPGVYDEGSSRHAETGWIKSTYAVTNETRCVIPRGVSVVADGDRRNTVIVGYKVPGSPAFPYYDAFKAGFSPDAIRGVAMAEDTFLKGFTVSNCSVYAYDKCAQTDNSMGAGILCKDRTARIEDCTITDCAAADAGCVYGGTFYRCRMTRGLAVGNGGCFYESACHNCFFDQAADAMGSNARGLYNCTFGPNNKYFGFTSGTLSSRIVNGCAWASSCGPISNCLFLAVTRDFTTNTYANASFCIFAYASDPGMVKVTSGTDNQIIRQSDLLAHYGSIADDYAPKATAPSIDVGCNLGAADVDCAGSQRIYNGTVDIGCYEWDWRPDFARMLVAHGNRFTVTAADPQVVKTGNAVEVRDGALNARWTMVGGSVAMGIDVRGNGTLSLYRGDELVETFTKASEKTYRLRSTAARGVPTDLRFVYAKADGDTEGALLSNFEDNNGTLIIFR